MIHDRGSIKWSSLMLPEHKRKLAELYQEQFYEKKPILDEQKQEEMNRLLMEGEAEDKEIEIVFFRNRGFHRIQGRIKKVNPLSGELEIILRDEGFISINLSEVVDVK
jgi:hypothetical protein